MFNSCIMDTKINVQQEDKKKSQFHSKTVDLAILRISTSMMKYFLFFVFQKKITKVKEGQVRLGHFKPH